MRLLFHILILPVFIFACALAVIWLPLPDLFPAPLSQSRNQIAAAVTGVLLMANIIWMSIYILGLLLQPGHAVDHALAPLELKAKSYLLFGRQYHGIVQERQVDITFITGRWGWTALNIYVKADLDTRAAIGEKRPLLDCRDCPRLPLNDPDLSHLAVFTRNEAWAKSLMVDSKGKAALSRLMADQKSFGLGDLYLQPGRI